MAKTKKKLRTVKRAKKASIVAVPTTPSGAENHRPSYAEIARSAGLSKSYVHRVLTQQRLRGPLATAKHIATAMDMTVDELIEELKIA